jgi:hypothetical protein
VRCLHVRPSQHCHHYGLLEGVLRVAVCSKEGAAEVDPRVQVWARECGWSHWSLTRGRLVMQLALVPLVHCARPAALQYVVRRERCTSFMRAPLCVRALVMMRRWYALAVALAA